MPAPKGKHIYGTVKVGEKGQIVIPSAARKQFGISAGDTIVVLGDEKRGLALIKADVLFEMSHGFFNEDNIKEADGDAGDKDD